MCVCWPLRVSLHLGLHLMFPVDFFFLTETQFFKQSSILLFGVFPVWNFGSKFEERSCENAVVLSFYQTHFRSFTTSQKQLELTYITYKGYCLSIVHVHTLALLEMTLCRTLWRISWTPKSGHTSPSVQPPGMDPVPSGMSSEPVLHFLRSYQVCWRNWMTADADTLAFSKYFCIMLNKFEPDWWIPFPMLKEIRFVIVW